MSKSIRYAFVCALVLGSSITAFAQPSIAPCSNVGGQTVLPLNSGSMTYCVGDYGWSDTWLVPALNQYDQNRDLLSGDDAGNLHYTRGGQQVPGTGWLSPILDRGTLAPNYPTGSPWTVQTATHYVGVATAESTIRNPADDLRLTIRTNVTGDTMTQTYILSAGDFAIGNILLADYFNYHPNGSINPNNLKGTITYAAGTLTTTGIVDPSFLSDGKLSGQVLDTFHGVGPVGPVVNMVENIAYDGSVGPFGPADVAGALAWNLGALGAGQSVSFTLTKMLVPEPTTMSLLALAGILGLRRRVR